MMFFLWTNWKSNFPLFNYFSVLLLRVVISSLRRQTKTIVYFFFRLAGQEEVDWTSAGDMKKNGWMAAGRGLFITFGHLDGDSRTLISIGYFFLNQHGILRQSSVSLSTVELQTDTQK